MSAHELDHLAIAVPAWAPAGTVLNRELGARWAGGFSTPDFNPCQLAVADDMRLELLEPAGNSHSFISRFLRDAGGAAAPHHITFKVQDIRAAIAGAQAAGIEPVLVNLEHPAWQEAFLHPSDTGLGFLVQMVQAPCNVEDIAGGLPNSTGDCPWPETGAPPRRVQLIFGVVADLGRASHVLVQILGADVFGIHADGEESAGQGERALVFHWEQGADLLLASAEAGHGKVRGRPATSPGIIAAGVLPPGQSWAPGSYPADVLDQLLADEPLPELGIGITVLQAAACPIA